jgi:hypothetical protein
MASGRLVAACRRPSGIGVIGTGPIPRARVRMLAPQSIAPSAFTPVAFDDDVWDTDDIHDPESHATRLTARTAGLYVMTASFEWESNPVGWRTAVLKVNAITNVSFAQQLAVKGGDTVQAITAQYVMNVLDYVELVVRQNSGGPLDLGGGPNIESNLSMSWVGP